MASEVPVGLEVDNSSTPSGGMAVTDGTWVYSARRLDGPEEPMQPNGEAHRDRRRGRPQSRTLLEAVSAMSSGEMAGQRSSLPDFNRPIPPRETAFAGEQPPIPEIPPPGVPRAAAVPLCGSSEPVLSTEPSSPLSAATASLGAVKVPASPADAPFAFVREVRPYFLDKPRLKLQHRVGELLFHSANRHGVADGIGAKSGGSERRKVAVELVHWLPFDEPESGQIKRWKAHAICTRSFQDTHESQKRSAPTASAQSDQAAADKMPVQGATPRGQKEFYLLAIPKGEIAKLQLSAGDKLMFRQRLQRNTATEDGIQMMVCSTATVRHMDSTSFASSSTAVDTAATSSIPGRQQPQQNGEVQNVHMLESGHRLGNQRGKKRSRERLESNEEYSASGANMDTTIASHSAGRRVIETVRNIDERKQELENGSGILLNASELAAVASLHRHIGGSFKDRPRFVVPPAFGKAICAPSTGPQVDKREIHVCVHSRGGISSMETVMTVSRVRAKAAARPAGTAQPETWTLSLAKKDARRLQLAAGDQLRLKHEGERHSLRFSAEVSSPVALATNALGSSRSQRQNPRRLLRRFATSTCTLPNPEPLQTQTACSDDATPVSIGSLRTTAAHVAIPIQINGVADSNADVSAHLAQPLLSFSKAVLPTFLKTGRCKLAASVGAQICFGAHSEDKPLEVTVLGQSTCPGTVSIASAGDESKGSSSTTPGVAADAADGGGCNGATMVIRGCVFREVMTTTARGAQQIYQLTFRQKDLRQLNLSVGDTMEFTALPAETSGGADGHADTRTNDMRFKMRIRSSPSTACVAVEDHVARMQDNLGPAVCSVAGALAADRGGSEQPRAQSWKTNGSDAMIMVDGSACLQPWSKQISANFLKEGRLKVPKNWGASFLLSTQHVQQQQGQEHLPSRRCAVALELQDGKLLSGTVYAELPTPKGCHSDDGHAMVAPLGYVLWIKKAGLAMLAASVGDEIHFAVNSRTWQPSGQTVSSTSTRLSGELNDIVCREQASTRYMELPLASQPRLRVWIKPAESAETTPRAGPPEPQSLAPALVTMAPGVAVARCPLHAGLPVVGSHPLPSKLLVSAATAEAIIPQP